MYSKRDQIGNSERLFFDLKAEEKENCVFIQSNKLKVNNDSRLNSRVSKMLYVSERNINKKDEVVNNTLNNGNKQKELKLKLPSAVSLKSGYNIKKNVKKGKKPIITNINENSETSYGEKNHKLKNLKGNVVPFVKNKIVKIINDDQNIKTEFSHQNEYIITNTNIDSEVVLSTNLTSTNKGHEFVRQSNNSLLKNKLNNLDVFSTEKSTKESLNRVNFHKDLNSNFQKLENIFFETSMNSKILRYEKLNNN